MRPETWGKLPDRLFQAGHAVFQGRLDLGPGEADGHQVVVKGEHGIDVFHGDLALSNAGSDGAAVDDRGLSPGGLPHDVGDEIAQVGFPGPDVFPVQVHLGLADDPLQEGIGLALHNGPQSPGPGNLARRWRG